MLPFYLTPDDLEADFNDGNDLDQSDLSDKEGDDEQIKKIKARGRFEKAIYDFTNAVSEEDRILQ